MADHCSLTVAEARAILIADGALALSFVAREACGPTFGAEELEAWLKLVESAHARIAEHGGPGASSMESPTAGAVLSPTASPGGNAADFQTPFHDVHTSSFKEVFVSRLNITDEIVDGLGFARACVLDQRAAAHMRENYSWDKRYSAALKAIDAIVGEHTRLSKKVAKKAAK